MAYSGTQTTRLGGYGGARPRRSFTAKTESTAAAIDAPITGIGYFEPMIGTGYFEPFVGSGRFEPTAGTGRL